MNERILIVEDDPAISKLIDTNLVLSGYQTVCAMDGRQAVEAIHAQRFDLALCDIMLPELDGFELLPYMKEKGIPVIYVSAKADVQSRVQGLRLGAEDYLVKPSMAILPWTWKAAPSRRAAKRSPSKTWNTNCCSPSCGIPAW